jgi:hypothetical protein
VIFSSFVFPLAVKPVAQSKVPLVVVLHLPAVHRETTLQEEQGAERSVQIRGQELCTLIPSQRGCENLIARK